MLYMKATLGVRVVCVMDDFFHLSISFHSVFWKPTLLVYFSLLLPLFLIRPLSSAFILLLCLSVIRSRHNSRIVYNARTLPKSPIHLEVISLYI